MARSEKRVMKDKNTIEVVVNEGDRDMNRYIGN